MERYRRAAAQLRSKGLQATPTALAKMLRVKPKHMHNMLNAWPELREYAGIVRSLQSKRERYEAVITSLVDRGQPITASAVAQELEMTLSGVYRYAARHAEKTKMPLKGRATALKEVYRMAADTMRREGNPLTRKSLAIEMGKPLATVQQYLWSHPEICAELGIEYTNDGHKRIYEKRRTES